MPILSGRRELRWAYIAFGLLAMIDLLMAACTVRHLHVDAEPMTPDAFLILLLLLAVQLLLLWLFRQVRTIIRMYRALREAHEQELHFARQLLECSAEGLMVLDAKGKVSYANKMACHLLGYSPEELRDRPVFQLIDPEQQKPLQEQWRTSWGCEDQTYAVQILDREGQLRPLRAVANPRWHQGRIVGSFAALSPLGGSPLSAPDAGLTSVPVP